MASLANVKERRWFLINFIVDWFVIFLGLCSLAHWISHLAGINFRQFAAIVLGCLAASLGGAFFTARRAPNELQRPEGLSSFKPGRGGWAAAGLAAIAPLAIFLPQAASPWIFVLVAASILLCHTVRKSV